MSPEKKETSQTSDRALAVLNLFADHEELGITEIAQEMGLGKATASRLVASLTNSDFLQQNPVTKKYRLGYRLVYLGDIAKERSAVPGGVLPLADALARSHQVSVTIMSMEGDECRILHKCEAGQTVNRTARTGALIPAYATASGKLMLAFSSKERQEEYLASTRLLPFTARTFTSPDTLRQEFARIRERGYAEDNEESAIGLCCVSVPLIRKGERVIMTISVNAATSLMQEHEEEYRQALLSLAARVSGA